MIRQALETYALATAREFATDRTQTVGASEIGQCARKTFYLKNEDDHAGGGTARDIEHNDRWGAKTRGTVYENHFWVPAMRRAYGDRLLYAGLDQRTFIREFLSATPDGLIVDLTDEDRVAAGILDGSDCVDLDCKTADPRTKLAEAKSEHIYQVNVQIGLIRELTNHKPTHGILSYTDASFWDEIKPFLVVFDPAVYEHSKRRAADIMTAPSAADLRPEGVIAGGRECELCPFTAACGRRRADLVPSNEKRAEITPEIGALAVRARTLRDIADTSIDEARQLEHEVRDALARIGARKVAGETGDGRKISISWAAMNGRPSFDAKGLRAAAEAAGVDTSVFSKAGDPTDRLVITLDTPNE